MTTQPLLKEIRYDRASRDYGMYLDGELVGFARTYHEAEVTLDDLVHEILTRDAVALADEAAERAELAEEEGALLPFEPTRAELVQTFAAETTSDGATFLVTTLAAHGLSVSPIYYPNGRRGWYVDLARSWDVVEEWAA